jgi:hypothetical protein
MINQPTGFKRMVVGMSQNMADQVAVNAVAELAEFLQVEVLATFVTDPRLRALAQHSTVREWRILDRSWHSLDWAQITSDIDRAASAARRRFAEAVSNCNIRTKFDVVTDVDVMTSSIGKEDIVVIIEPSHPGEQITWQFADVLGAALESAGAVLVMPQRIARSAGPVLVIASSGQDTSIPIALQIAAALKEELIAVVPSGVGLATTVLAGAKELGIHVEQVTKDWLSGPFGLGLHSAKERLRVITRSGITGDAPRIFSCLQGVPLLIIAPERSMIH